MKKILAILLVFSMLFAFAACGGNTEEPTEPTTTEDLFAEFEDDATQAPEVDVTDSPEADETEASTADATDAPAADSTDASAAETTAVETTAASKGLNSTDIAEIVAYYNAARKATNPAPAGQSSMKLVGDITGDGTIGAILSVLTPAAEKALAKNSQSTNYIPAHEHPDVKVSDVTKAQASSKNGVTTIVIQLKDQVDGSDGDPKDGGAVARGVGTLGSIDVALKELGAEIIEGRETVKLTYTDAYIKCTVNEETGMITGGTWHHMVNVFVGDAKAKLGLSANLKNFKATVEYQVVI